VLSVTGQLLSGGRKPHSDKTLIRNWRSDVVVFRERLLLTISYPCVSVAFNDAEVRVFTRFCVKSSGNLCRLTSVAAKSTPSTITIPGYKGLLLIISDLLPRSNHNLICSHAYGSDPQKFAPTEVGNPRPCRATIGCQSAGSSVGVAWESNRPVKGRYLHRFRNRWHM
jgi:hypothetical protein